IASNTLGLLALFGALVVAYLVSVKLTGFLAGPGSACRRHDLSLSLHSRSRHRLRLSGRARFARFPDVQWAIRAASDPLTRGWDLLGTHDPGVTPSFLSHRCGSTRYGPPRSLSS